MMSAEIEVKNTAPAAVADNFLDYALSHGFGDLHFKVDPATGMRAIIAIHSTKLGPALGGCRFIEYADVPSAINDAMRLARGMSYKAAAVNLPFGGGKSVIIKPPHPFDREAYMRSFGQFVNDLGGRYITALDSGTSLEDMDIIRQHTPYVASLSSYNGDPSPFTAEGVFKGIQAAVEFGLNRHNLDGLHIAIQGLGHVGYALAGHLHKAGVRLSVSDLNQAAVASAVREFGATAVPSDIIHQIPCDVFAPCALGAILNDISINQLQTSIIAGAANNQLAHGYHARILQEKGILYTPDYVINAGGLIYAASRYLHTAENLVEKQIEAIKTSLLEIFAKARAENKSPAEIADTLAREKLA